MLGVGAVSTLITPEAGTLFHADSHLGPAPLGLPPGDRFAMALPCCSSCSRPGGASHAARRM